VLSNSKQNSIPSPILNVLIDKHEHNQGFPLFFVALH